MSSNQSDEFCIGKNRSTAWENNTTPNSTTLPEFHPEIPPVLKFCIVFFETYTSVAICIVGIIGNAVSLKVLQAADLKKQKASNWLLQLLAVADILFLAIFMLQTGINELLFNYDLSEVVIFVVYSIVNCLCPLVSMTHLLAKCTVVLVTIDRYLAVCRPMLLSWRTLRRMKLAALLMTIIAAVTTVPHYLHMELWLIPFCENGGFLVYIGYNHDIYWNPLFQLLYMFFWESICKFLLPLVVLITLNVTLVRHLWILDYKRRAMAKETRRHKNVTTTIVILVTVYFVCELPLATIEALWSLYIALPLDWLLTSFTTYKCFLRISTNLRALNSCLNFVIYVLAWKKFRRILIQKMPCSKPTVMN